MIAEVLIGMRLQLQKLIKVVEKVVEQQSLDMMELKEQKFRR